MSVPMNEESARELFNRLDEYIEPVVGCLNLDKEKHMVELIGYLLDRVEALERGIVQLEGELNGVLDRCECWEDCS